MAGPPERRLHAEDGAGAPGEIKVMRKLHELMEATSHRLAAMASHDEEVDTRLKEAGVAGVTKQVPIGIEHEMCERERGAGGGDELLEVLPDQWLVIEMKRQSTAECDPGKLSDDPAVEADLHKGRRPRRAKRAVWTICTGAVAAHAHFDLNDARPRDGARARI